MGGIAVRVPSAQRTRYHAGAVLSANLAMALLDAGVGLLVGAGVPDDLARQGLARLLRSAADGALARPLRASLTGPVSRGDADTIRRHLALLDDDDRIYVGAWTRIVVRAATDDEKIAPTA